MEGDSTDGDRTDGGSTDGASTDGGDQHRIFSVNLITATPLRGVPAQRFGFLLSRSPEWLSQMFDEPSLVVYFKTFNFLHTARWMTLGRFPRVSPDQPREPLSPRWLLFMANFDGDWDAYFATFMQAMGEGVYDIWGRSVGYPGFPAPGTSYRLVDWLDTRIVDSQHYYAAYPHATANDVRAAARVRREVRSTAIDLEATEVGRGADVGLVFDDLARRLAQCLGPVGRPAAGWEEPPAAAEGHIRGVAGVFPVLPGHEDLLREAAAALGDGPASPFFMVPGTHFARLALLHRDEVGRYPGGRRRPGSNPAGSRNPVTVNRLANSYLVLAADVDGAGDRRSAHDRFFRTLLRVAPGAVDSLFSHCWGYASVHDDRDFADLAWRCRRPVVREYMDYSDESLRSVLAALSGHPAFVDLVERRRRGQRVTPIELESALR